MNKYFSAPVALVLAIAVTTCRLSAQPNNEDTTDATEAAADAAIAEADAAIKAAEDSAADADGNDSSASDAAALEEAASALLSGDLPDLQPEDLPQADELVPDESLLIEAPSYIPSYEEIVRQSQDIVQEYSEPGLEMRQNISMRKARTKALNDDAIQAARQFALEQKFFPEQQQAWKEYFDLLYTRMAKLEPDMKDVIEAEKIGELTRIGLPPAPEKDDEEQ